MGVLIPMSELTQAELSDYRKNIASDLVNAVSNKSRIDSDRLVLRDIDPIADLGFGATTPFTITTAAAANTFEDFVASTAIPEGKGFAFYGVIDETVSAAGGTITKIQWKKGVTPIELLFTYNINQENGSTGFPAGIMNKAQIYVEDDELNIQVAQDVAAASLNKLVLIGLTCEQSGENFVQ